MAVAVKNTPEVTSASLLDRMAIASLAGAAYVLGTLGIVFYLIPSLWQSLGWEGHASLVIRGLIQVAAVTGLLVFGVRLLGPKTAAGVRAGIVVSLLGVLLILLLTRWASLWIEFGSYDRELYGPSAGAILTSVFGLGLLALGIRFFLRPGTERFLVQLEGQGLFSARPYKALQGLRVRRGTTAGILFLIAPGIWLCWNGPLRRGPADWQLNVPFTGRVVVQSTGDVKPDVLAKYVPEWENQFQDHTLVVDRYTLQEINGTVDPARNVKIIEPGSSRFAADDVVSRDEYNAEVQKLKKEEAIEPQVAAPQPATGPVTYRTMTLLPSVQLTVPLLMLAAGLWLAWRVVNVPAFADFLIATEAEMNKVSWTTQRRLIQDTLVVLVTVVLMAFYLFSMDVVWKAVLSWEPIGVIKFSSDNQREAAQPPEDRPW
ncbi:MAG TPA: preprotein translocase subunit SecE [Gemmataceae bacterium]|nr:preprotein translocase subunit SecE [Gemmataceae bacterium]